MRVADEIDRENRSELKERCDKKNEQASKTKLVAVNLGTGGDDE